MGVVHEAYDPELNRRVAIKLLRPGRAGANAQQRLVREAQATAMLSHPNVVQIYDVGTVRDQVFLALELVRGQTVAQWLRERRRPWAQVLSHFVAAGRGLAAAHAAGIVHRDFKPSNILIDEQGRARVADFGVASLDTAHDSHATTGPNDHSLTASLTSTGAVVGTPVYMAPEQHQGQRVDAAADQFSFCVALHEALYSERPFAGRTPVELAEHVAQGDYRAPADRGGVPVFVANAVRRGLATDPKQRHPSMAALLETLQHDPRRHRRRRIYGATLAGAVAVAGWAVATRPSPQMCQGGAVKIAEAWSALHRSETTAAFDHADDANLADTREVILARVDDYSQQWVEAHDGVCLAHRDGEFSTTSFDAAMACLDRRRGALETFVELVSSADPVVLAHATEAAASLHAVEICLDRELLALDLAPPPDAAAAKTVLELRDTIARAQVQHHAGAIDAARAALATVELAAVELGYAPLSAELDLVMARLAMDRSDYAYAYDKLDRALDISVAAGADAIAAEAISRRLFTEVMTRADLEPVMADVGLARALMQRIGEPAALDALLANNTAVLHAALGDREQASQMFEAAVRRSEGAPGVNAVDRSEYLVNVARHTADPEQRDARFEQAEDALSRTLGAHHIRNIEFARRRAEYTADPAASVARFETTCERVRQRMPDDEEACQRCYFRLGELQDALGRHDAAISSLHDGVGCLAAPSDEAGMTQALHLQLRGYEALLRDTPQQALAPLQAAKTMLEPMREHHWIARVLATTELLQARALSTLDRGTEGVAALRDAISIFEHQAGRTYSPIPGHRHAVAQAVLATILLADLTTASEGHTLRERANASLSAHGLQWP